MTIYALSRFQTPIYGSKKTHMSFTNPYRSRFQTPIYDSKKTPIKKTYMKSFRNDNICSKSFPNSNIWL